MSVRRLSARSLENSALFYLRRYAATVKGLRRVLLRKVDRALKVHPGVERVQAVQWVDELLARFEKNGYLDDRRFAEVRAGSLQRRGASVRLIQVRLRAKGVSPELIAQSVRGLAEEGRPPDWVAAVAYARRRRLGPFRKKPLDGRPGRMKELASFARAGFGFALAAKIVDASDEEALSNG